MKRNAVIGRSAVAVVALASLLLLAGCEAIFTYTPLKAFQRPAANLPAAERLSYAQDALASGDIAAMKDAYNAIKNDKDPGAQYTAAQLGIEVSGVPALLLQAVSGQVSLPTSTTPAAITSFFEAHPSVDPSYLIAAANNITNVPPADLAPMDFVYGTVGLVLQAAQQPNGTFDFANVDPAQMASVTTLTTYAKDNVVPTLAPTDPVVGIMTSFSGFLPGI